jgi:hypothetical protein
MLKLDKTHLFPENQRIAFQSTMRILRQGNWMGNEQIMGSKSWAAYYGQQIMGSK